MHEIQSTYADSIADQLLESIRSGQYGEGARLPSLRKLASRHKVSVSTVRSAVQKLISNNEIVAVHGSGCYIRRKRHPKKNRHVLIFNRPGEMYNAMLDDLLLFRGNHPEMSVTVESLNQSAERIQARIERLLAEGLDTIFLNSITLPQLNFMEQYLDKLNIYGFFHLPHKLTRMSFLPGVYSDWFHGGYIGTRHLIDCGCKNILLILSSQGSLQQDCLDGALAANEDAQSPVKLTTRYNHDIYHGHNFQPDDLKNYIRQPDFGIFSFSHRVALKVYDWIKSNGFKIPDDVFLLEYYDSQQSLDFNPPLTSISVCPKEISAKLFQMFISGHREYITIKPRLIKRESTGYVSRKTEGIS